MSEHFDDLIAGAEQSYRAIVARSWTLLTEHLRPDNVEGMLQVCEIQRELIVAGAAWLAACQRAYGSVDQRNVPAAMPASAEPAPSEGASLDSPPPPPSTPAQPRARARRAEGQVADEQSAVETPPAEVDDSSAQAPHSAEESVSGAPRRRGRARASAAVAPEHGQMKYQGGDGPRVHPLLPSTVLQRRQPTAMAFNGSSWMAISAWRRIFQHVLQTLERNDPERFSAMAEKLTLNNGRLLFSRDRTASLTPMDAGGGWYTTGQMPTELILQRLRTVLEWWQLPLTTLEVELAPSPADAPATSANADIEPAAPAVSDATEDLPVALETTASTGAPESDTVPLETPASDTTPPETSRDDAAPLEMLASDTVQPETPEGETAEAVASIESATSTAESATSTETIDVIQSEEPAVVEEPEVVPEASMSEDTASAEDQRQEAPGSSNGVHPLEEHAEAPPVSLVSEPEGLPSDAPPAEEAAETPQAPEVQASPEVPVPVEEVEPATAEPAPAPASPTETLPPRAETGPAEQVAVPEESSEPVIRPAVRARRSPNVRWVKTATGTSLPLRPGSSDE